MYYDVEFRIDSYDNDCDYSEKMKTLAEAKRYIKELVKKFGERLASACIKKWDDSDAWYTKDYYSEGAVNLVDSWEYDVDKGIYYHL